MSCERDLMLAEFRALQRRWVRTFGRRDPHLAISIAGLTGVGVRLSAEECATLVIDNAIHTAALQAEAILANAQETNDG